VRPVQINFTVPYQINFTQHNSPMASSNGTVSHTTGTLEALFPGCLFGYGCALRFTTERDEPQVRGSRHRPKTDTISAVADPTSPTPVSAAADPTGAHAERVGVDRGTSVIGPVNAPVVT
jgi:hypothetical protein